MIRSRLIGVRLNNWNHAIFCNKIIIIHAWKKNISWYEIIFHLTLVKLLIVAIVVSLSYSAFHSLNLSGKKFNRLQEWKLSIFLWIFLKKLLFWKSLICWTVKKFEVSMQNIFFSYAQVEHIQRKSCMPWNAGNLWIFFYSFDYIVTLWKLCSKPEAATRDVLRAKPFLKIFQCSQENTCVGVSF